MVKDVWINSAGNDDKTIKKLLLYKRLKSSAIVKQ